MYSFFFVQICTLKLFNEKYRSPFPVFQELKTSCFFFNFTLSSPFIEKNVLRMRTFYSPSLRKGSWRERKKFGEKTSVELVGFMRAECGPGKGGGGARAIWWPSGRASLADSSFHSTLLVNFFALVLVFKTDSAQSSSNKCKNYLLKIYSQQGNSLNTIYWHLTVLFSRWPPDELPKHSREI